MVMPCSRSSSKPSTRSARELARLQQSGIEAEAADLAKSAVDGIVVARLDGRPPDALRQLAQAVRRHDGVRTVVLGGLPEPTKVALAASSDGTPDAAALVKKVAPLVGGGGGGTPELAVAGGREPDKLDDALSEARRVLSGA